MGYAFVSLPASAHGEFKAMNGSHLIIMADRLSFSFAAFMANDIATTNNAWVFRNNGLMGAKL